MGTGKCQLFSIGPPGQVVQAKIKRSIGMRPQAAVVLAIGIYKPYFCAAANVGDSALRIRWGTACKGNYECGKFHGSEFT